MKNAFVHFKVNSRYAIKNKFLWLGERRKFEFVSASI